MASPRYGERWARHWLDVTGYADSDGNGNDDSPRPYSYKYRDYVVRSMNADKPLDRFVIEQLAGDELVPRPWNDLTPEKAELLAATGFLRTAADGTSTGAADEPLAANQVVADTLKIVGSTLLGLTVGCAQCHDHRYDPIPQADYYRLRAIFEPALDTNHWRRPAQRLVSLFKDADRAKCKAIEAEAAKLQKVVDAKTKTYLEAATKKELAKFPEPLRTKLRAALDVAARVAIGRAEAFARIEPKREYHRGRPLPVRPGRCRGPQEGNREGRRQTRGEAGRRFRQRAR